LNHIVFILSVSNILTVLLQNGYLRNMLFMDIETVPRMGSFDLLPEAEKELWAIKHATLKIAGETAEEGYLKRAGVYSEFAKVICMSIGFFRYDREANADHFRLRSIYGDDEHQLLSDVVTLFNRHFPNDERFRFCGHNIKEFDVPFLCRRMVINNLKLPALFDISGKKPWETEMVDTLQLWKFGDVKNYTSLKLLTHVLGIPSPKEDIEGKDVCPVYYNEPGGLNRIVEYCQRDVVTVARLLMRFRYEPDYLEDKDVVISTAMLS
jgi:hypothetical protein